MMLITIKIAAGGNAEMTIPGEGGTHPTDTAGDRKHHRRPKPAAIRRTRSRTPWNTPSSVF